MNNTNKLTPGKGATTNFPMINFISLLLIISAIKILISILYKKDDFENNRYVTRKEIMQELINEQHEKYKINEELLQSYRQIFIGSQSFFLAVGTILFTSVKNLDCLLLLLTSINVFIIWFVWFRVVRVRHLIVDFHKYYYEYLKNNREIPDGVCNIKEYIDVFKWKKRKETTRRLGFKRNWRLARIKIDLILPITFTFVWLLLAFYGKPINAFFYCFPR